MRSPADRSPETAVGTAAPPGYADRPKGRAAEAERAGGAVASLVSVVVLVTERPEPLADLYREYAESLRAAGRPFEFLFILEPWNARLAAPLRELARDGEPVRVLESGRTLGEAAQLKLAGSHVHGELLLALPAYRRVEADCLPRLVERVEEGADLVLARRWPRRDSWLNRLQNRLFHALVRVTGGRRFHDIACGVRAMRRELLSEIPLDGEFSRFLPLLAVQEGFAVEEVPCPQHPQDRQTRIYSPGIYLRRLIDLFGVFFLLRFTYKPLRFFGLVGSALSVTGAAILLVLLAQRMGGQPMADRPMLLLGVLLFTLGVQVIALGLVGELIVHFSVPSKLGYRLREDGSGRA